MRGNSNGDSVLKIYTATERRPEVARVWCAAVSATLQQSHTATILYSQEKPGTRCVEAHVQVSGPTVAVLAMQRYAPKRGERMFLEEDMIPVRPWTLADYPGRRLYAEGSPGRPWPALTILRDNGGPDAAIVPQRFVRDGGCPDWLPVDLCEPALRANAKVLGQHFLHLDKMYRPEVPEAAAKNHLLELLRQRFADVPPARPGLGDMVAAGLSAVGITPERVSKALGVKDCGCKGRAEALNALGRRLGIG